MTRLHYWLHAKNQYSIHSPFIFDLYRHVLFTRNNTKHFFAHSRYSQLCYMFANYYNLNIVKQSDFYTLLQGNSSINKVLIFKKPHKTKESEIAWKKLINDANYQVSIDIFDIGILLKNPHLHKQHFLLR